MIVLSANSSNVAGKVTFVILPTEILQVKVSRMFNKNIFQYLRRLTIYEQNMKKNARAVISSGI